MVILLMKGNILMKCQILFDSEKYYMWQGRGLIKIIIYYNM